jgi:hypothetical protein
VVPARRGAPPHPPPAPQTDEHSTRRTTAQHGGFAGTIVVSLACGANQFGLSRSAERSLAVAPHARCAPARRATATVARGPPCDSVARGLVLSHLSALAARETKTRQRSSRGQLLHHAGTAGAVAQAATRRVVARPSPLRSRLSRSAALPRHERAASSRRRESATTRLVADLRLRRRCRGEDAQLSCASGSSSQRGPTARCFVWPG